MTPITLHGRHFVAGLCAALAAVVFVSRNEGAGSLAEDVGYIRHVDASYPRPAVPVAFSKTKRCPVYSVDAGAHLLLVCSDGAKLFDARKVATYAERIKAR